MRVSSFIKRKAFRLGGGNEFTTRALAQKQQIEDSEKMIEKMMAVKNSGEEYIEVSLSDSKFKAKVSTTDICIFSYNSIGTCINKKHLSLIYWKPFYEILHQIFGEKE